MTNEVCSALKICPEVIRRGVERLSLHTVDGIEEIRMYRGRETVVRSCGKSYTLDGALVTAEHLRNVMGAATAQSAYAAAQMLSNGFITISGGHRLGICGETVIKNGEITTLRDISSLNLRVARQVVGIADSLCSHIWLHQVSTLIVGPPGCGKTTLLRDLIRQLSNCFDWRIAVVDERLELAAASGNCMGFDLGRNTDVLSGIGKEKGIELLLRGMNPQWIAVDEITAQEDVEAICRGSYCGVGFLATAHASSKNDLYSRPVYRQLIECGIFQNIVLLNHNRTYTAERLNDQCSRSSA